jgi:hypothetical protein
MHRWAWTNASAPRTQEDEDTGVAERRSIDRPASSTASRLRRWSCRFRELQPPQVCRIRTRTRFGALNVLCRLLDLISTVGKHNYLSGACYDVQSRDLPSCIQCPGAHGCRWRWRGPELLPSMGSLSFDSHLARPWTTEPACISWNSRRMQSSQSSSCLLHSTATRGWPPRLHS